MKKSLLVLLLILTLVAVSVFAVACGNSSEPAQNNEDNNETVEVPEYPTQPITIMTAWSAGSSSDLFARIIAEYATAKWGVPVNVINKPGGFGIPGTTELLSSKPDGYTIGVGGQACSSMMCAMYGDQLPFGIEDRTYIAKLVDLPSIFAVNAKSEFYTLEDLIKFAQENPDKFRYSAGSVTSIYNFTFGELFKEAGGIDINGTKVGFEGGHADAVAALLGGHITTYCINEADYKQYCTGDKPLLRALAVGTTERLPIAPDVPTTAEAGYPGASLIGWYGVTGPANLPDYVVDAWTKLLEEGANDPAFRDKINATGYTLNLEGPDALWEIIQKQYNTATTLIKELGMTFSTN